jgi:hypothetical protein
VEPVTLPAALLERARAYAAGTVQPPVPRDAATVVLLRDQRGREQPGHDRRGDDRGGIEAYVLRRVVGMAFAGGMHVFPGGAVDPRDADEDLPWVGPDLRGWAPRLRADEPLTRELVCAAVRETFEESGVLLAGPDGGRVVADTSSPDWERERRALLDRGLAFSALLARRGLVLRADLLRPWTHWITPEFEERRYDTRFFVAALPDGQRTRDVGGEADWAAWVRPADAVAAWERGGMAMLPPTVVTLRDLTAYRTVADVLTAADRRVIRPLLPRPVWEGGELYLLLPGEPGYPA